MLLLQAAAKQAPQLTREQMADMRRANDPNFKAKAKEAKGKAVKVATVAGGKEAATKAEPAAMAAPAANAATAAATGRQQHVPCCCAVLHVRLGVALTCSMVRLLLIVLHQPQLGVQASWQRGPYVTLTKGL